MLSVHGGAEQVAAAAAIGLRAGDDLSERRIGTNAVGLVVRTGRAAWIHGPEHFLHRMHQLTGAAAPVHDPDGRLVGVLMIAGGVRVAKPEILALVKATPQPRKWTCCSAPCAPGSAEPTVTGGATPPSRILRAGSGSTCWVSGSRS
ncbi:GAF domain-containing protein [Nocardia sp. NPDC004573]